MNSSLNRGCELLVLELSKKYGFDPNEALEYLGVQYRTVGLNSEKVVGGEAANKVVGEKKKRKKCIPMPWTGIVCKENCQALDYNNGLFTQCGSAKELGKNYCEDCVIKQEENNGYLEYGTVEDRMKKDFQGKGGKGVIPYGNVLQKKKITREEAQAAAREKGVEIPEHYFEVEVRKRGRPKKVSTAVEDTPEKKKRGRPGKRVGVTVVSEGGNTVDLIRNVAGLSGSGSASSGLRVGVGIEGRGRGRGRGHSFSNGFI